jgi:hypothetical protein
MNLMLKSSRKYLARLAQRTGVSALSALKATKLLLFCTYISDTDVQKLYDSDDRAVLKTSSNSNSTGARWKKSSSSNESNTLLILPFSLLPEDGNITNLRNIMYVQCLV